MPVGNLRDMRRALLHTAHVTCRWLSYVNGALQFVPCGPDGLTLPADVDPNAFRLPPGYLEEVDHADDCRCHWTAAPQHVPPDTWLKDNCLKYSAAEMLGRGETAEQILRQAAAGELPKTTALAQLRQLGVKGATMFSALSYFKCA